MPIYFDHNATTPLCKEVCEEMQKFLDPSTSYCFGNPSSAHSLGYASKQKLETSRAKIAKFMKTDKNFIVFTSSGTESNNLVILSLSAQNQHGEIISCPCEHPSAENPINHVKAQFSVKHKILPCLKSGAPDIAQLRELLSTNTFLVTTMLAQNEIGSITKIAEMYEIIQNFNKENSCAVKFHVDASQAVGKTKIEFSADFMTVAPHKFYGPRGVGILLCREKLQSIQFGADQEGGVRPGTENLMQIAGAAAACDAAEVHLEDRIQSSAKKVQLIYNRFKAENLSFIVNGAAAGLLEKGEFLQHFSQPDQICLSNTLSVSFKSVPANSVISALGNEVCLSAGAACHSDRVDISETLKVIGIPAEFAMGTLRISVGEFVSLDESLIGADKIVQIVRQYQGVQQDVSSLSLSQSDNSLQIVSQDVISGQNTVLSQTASINITNITQPDQNTKVNIQQPENNAVSAVTAQPLQICPAIPESQNLLNLTSGLGCACKLRPQALQRVLKSINFGSDPKILVSQSTADDACVYQLNNQVLVSTTDFFSPVIDDAYLFGKISAANALSDVYAMNARPSFAIAIAGFPSTRMSESQMVQIIQGAVDKCKEAGIVISGGHTIESIEPFFGLCVNGVRDEFAKIKLNRIPSEKCQNDVYLVMTKSLGVGILATGLKRGLLQNRDDFQTIYDALVSNMEGLNKIDEELPDSVIALTDVTGFGLAGHLAEMISQDKLSAEIYTRSLPVLPGVKELYDLFQKTVLTNENNKIYVEQSGYDLSQVGYWTDIVTDATTSGGLLFAVKGWNSAVQIAEKYDGCIVGHVYKDDSSQKIILTDDKSRENVQRGIGFFK